MFRIRNSDGSTTPLPKGAFVELVAPDGRLGGVWYAIAQGPAAHILPGSEDAQRYARMFPGTEFVSVTNFSKP